MTHSHILIFNFTLHMHGKFSRGKHWCTSRCWCSPTQHTSEIWWQRRPGNEATIGLLQKDNICMAYCDPTHSHVHCPKHFSLLLLLPQECHGLDTNNIVDGTTIDQFRGCNIITTGGVYIGHISDSAFKWVVNSCTYMCMLVHVCRTVFRV